MKKCSRCLKVKDEKEFINSSGKPTSRCLTCNENRKVLARNRHHRRKNDSDYKLLRKDSRLKSKYGITVKEYEAILFGQNGLCAICQRNLLFFSNKKDEPCVDHNHQTGKVRGILCRGCNLSLSMVENKEFFLNAINYLKKSENA